MKFCFKLWFSNPHIFAPRYRKPLIFQTLNSVDRKVQFWNMRGLTYQVYQNSLIAYKWNSDYKLWVCSKNIYIYIYFFKTFILLFCFIENKEKCYAYVWFIVLIKFSVYRHLINTLYDFIGCCLNNIVCIWTLFR